MNGNIYNSKVMVFKSDAVDALKAATTIDAKTYTHVVLYDNVVLVSFDNDVERPKYNRTLKGLIDECEKVLNEYKIEYKIKIMKF